ncbi:MAG: TRAP transporter substrate-binding protein DctP [Acidobacteriota bacterium]|nr:TRAP transporter substrate-binding protein DctP [Acidobacteriota bacterium]
MKIEWSRGGSLLKAGVGPRTVMVVTLLGVVALWSAAPGLAASDSVLKLATLVPEGSVWDKALREMGATWKQASSGRVTLTIYPGGVAGSEHDVLRKMRIGQLQAGSLTTAGLEHIDAGFKVLTIPLFYDSYDEFFHVLSGLAPELERRLEVHGYVLLHWGHAGWVHFFSRRPMHTIDDLRRFKIFVTAGSDDMVAWWTRNGFQPVALSPTDIMTGLQTGMIDVLPTTPLAGLSLQWFRQTPYMHDLGLAPLTGATIVSKRAWERLDENDRTRLLAVARKVGARLEEEIPRQDKQAVAEMEARGLRVTTSTDMPQWEKTAKGFAASMRGAMVPEDVYDRAVALRDEYRRQQQGGGDS